ncbi:MAG: DUF5655 domain-containing protein, partial [Elusimicrobiota bacterium]
DQGFAYLALMLNNKADFVLEYNEKNKEALSRGEVDWSQSGIIFIANRFTQHQLKAINFQDLPIELWEVQEYENSLIKYEQLRTPGASASIKDLSTDQTISKVSQEVKKYTIEDHFKEDWENSRELFEAFREQLLSFEERFEETPLKKYIGYKLANKNLCEVVAQKSGLKIYLDIQKNALQDPENMTRDVSEVGHWGTGDTEFKLKKLGNVGYAMFLIKQIYKNFTNES